MNRVPGNCSTIPKGLNTCTIIVSEEEEKKVWCWKKITRMAENFLHLVKDYLQKILPTSWAKQPEDEDRKTNGD